MSPWSGNMKRISLTLVSSAFLFLSSPTLSQNSVTSPVPPRDSKTNTQTNISSNQQLSVITGVCSAIVTGLISSAMFWYWLYRKKPKILISQNIAKFPYDGDELYAIKIVNKTSDDLINVKFELLVATTIGTSSTTDRADRIHIIPKIKLEEIQIGRNNPIREMMIIEKFSRDDHEAKYAQQIVTKINIEDLCHDNNQFLSFRIIATHASSGFSKNFERRYDHPLNGRDPTNTIIKSGMFVSGESMEIK